jgi:hypothetical protein
MLYKELISISGCKPLQRAKQAGIFLYFTHDTGNKSRFTVAMLFAE